MSATQSSPVVQENNNTAKERSNKKVCTFYLEGRCERGNDQSHLSKFLHEAPTPLLPLPVCKYHVKGVCTRKDDPTHLQQFVHPESDDLQRALPDIGAQPYDFYLILNLEGKEEILEFPVLLLPSKNLNAIQIFHLYCRPTSLSTEQLNSQIEHKFGRYFDMKNEWNNAAISFVDIVSQFEQWMINIGLLVKNSDGVCVRNENLSFAFVTLGNWDLRNQIPKQYELANLPLPKYFSEWVSLKDLFYTFYGTKPLSIRHMLSYFSMPAIGFPHLGIYDIQNMARTLVRIMEDKHPIHTTTIRESNGKLTYKNEFKHNRPHKQQQH